MGTHGRTRRSEASGFGHSRRWRQVTTLTLVVAFFASVPVAHAAAPRDPVLVSHPGAPLTGCNPAVAPVPDADHEATVAADPHDASRLVAAWRADRTHAVGAAWSHDHGHSWHRVALPQLSQCAS